jgi:hypothetical protein
VARLKAERPEFNSWQGARDSSFLYRVQTGSGAQPASYPMDTGPLPQW